MSEQPTALGFVKERATWCLLAGIAAMVFLFRGASLRTPYYFGILGSLAVISIFLGHQVMRQSSPPGTLGSAGWRVFVGLMLAYFSALAMASLYVFLEIGEQLMRRFN